MDVRIARIYDDPDDVGGHWVFVDRLWPRGVKKEQAPWNEWRKDLAPSDDVRKAYHSGELDFDAFAQAYRSELEARDEPHGLDDNDIVLVTAANHRDKSHVVVLQDWLMDQRRTPTRWPEAATNEYRPPVPPTMAAHSDPTPPTGVTPRTTDLTVRFSDIDGMGHMNNARYLTFTEEARTHWVTEEIRAEDLSHIDFILARAEVDFRAPANLGEVIRVEMWCSHIGSKSWEFSYRMFNVETGQVVAVAKTTQVAYDYEGGASKPIPERYLKSLRRLHGDEGPDHVPNAA